MTIARDYAAIKNAMKLKGHPVSDGPGFTIEDHRRFVEFAHVVLGMPSRLSRWALAYPGLIEKRLLAHNLIANGEFTEPLVEAPIAPAPAAAADTEDEDDTPPLDVPPTDTPPLVDTPPADAPPADQPPVETPPTDTPPADAPAEEQQEQPEGDGATESQEPQAPTGDNEGAGTETKEGE